MLEPDLPFSALTPMTTLLVAVALNLLLCSASRVGAIFSLPNELAGRLITTLEGRYNTPHATDAMRRADSISVAVILMLVGLSAGLGAGYLFEHLPYSWVLESMLIAALLSLRPHLERLRFVERAIAQDLNEARATLTLMTGRDAARLDRTGIAAATIESSAMALPQGFLAPLLWYALGGLPLLFAFKIVDTASAMIDERAENARSFGHAPRAISAIFIAPAAAFSGLLAPVAALLLPAASLRSAFHALTQGGRYAWPVFSIPVAAFAGALSTRLGGHVCIGQFERSGDDIGVVKAPPPEPEILPIARKLFLIAAGLTVLVLAALAAAGIPHPFKLF